MIRYNTGTYHYLIKMIQKLHHTYDVFSNIDLKIKIFLLDVFAMQKCFVRNRFCYFVNHMIVLVLKYGASGIDIFF